MKTFLFKTTNDANQQNWDLLYQLNKSTVTAVELKGFSKGYCWGYFVLDGPRVHVYIWLYGDPTWGSDSYLIFPTAPLQLVLPTGKEDFHQFIGPFINVATGLPVNNSEYYRIITSPVNAKQAHLLLPDSGSISGSATLNGTYLRN